MANVLVKKCVSAFGSVNWRDIGKGFVVAFTAAVIASIGQGLEAGQLPTQAQLVIALKTGFAAGCAYLGKQILSGPVKQEKE